MYFNILFSSDYSKFSVSSFKKFTVKGYWERLWIVIQTIHAQVKSPNGMTKYGMHFGNLCHFWDTCPLTFQG